MVLQRWKFKINVFLGFLVIISIVSFIGFSLMTKDPPSWKGDNIVKKSSLLERSSLNTGSGNLETTKLSSINLYKGDDVKKGKKLSIKSNTFLDYAVHIFYYPWYKNPAIDGKYEHWNHQLIPHWSDKTQTRQRHHIPPGDIGANFYPELGAYSSADPKVIRTHMRDISNAGVGKSHHVIRNRTFNHFSGRCVSCLQYHKVLWSSE